MKANRKIMKICLIIILGVVLGTIILIVKNRFEIFLTSAQSWSDFTDTLSFTVKRNFSAGSYFPFSYVIMTFLEKISLGEYRTIYLITYFLCTTVVILLTNLLLKEHVNNKLKLFICTLIIVLMPFSMIFEFSRGNIEIIVLVFCLLFYYLYKKEKYTLAGIILSCAITMKLYPALLAFLLLYKKKYKEFIICALMSVGIGLISYFLMIDILGTIPKYIDKFSGFLDVFSKSKAGLLYNHSLLFGIYWLLNNIFNIDYEILFASSIIKIYTPIVIVIAIIIIYFLRNEIDEWKKVTILTLMMVTFPPTSFDYTLIALTIPIIAFIKDDKTAKWEDNIYSFLFGLLIIPMNFCEYIGLILRPLIATTIILTVIISNIIKNNQYLRKVNDKIKKGN